LTGNELYSDNSPVYTLSIYPNDDFFKEYRTGNPMRATIVVIAATFITSLVFFLYDFFVRREFRTKSNLLEAKRRYMRYISHEVRTPLSSVFMGLSVVQNVLALCLGYNSVETLEDDLALVTTRENGKPDSISQLACSKNTSGSSNNNSSSSSKEILECFQLTKEIQLQAQGM
jgi:signal transduction histidine kinase